MQLTIDERAALATRTTLNHTQLKQREADTGFAATLEELARADQAEVPKTGEDWWLARLMAPVVNQQPPPDEYELAKVENESRHALKMRPNEKTLMTQYHKEIFDELWDAAFEKLLEENPNPTDMEVQALREQVEAQAEEMAQAKTDKVIADWEAGIQNALDEMDENQDLIAQFEAQFEAAKRTSGDSDDEDLAQAEESTPFHQTQRFLEEIQQSMANKVELKQAQKALSSLL